MKKEFIQSIKIIILGVILSLGVGYLFAWVKSPTAIPPDNNVPILLNVSPTPTPQKKGNGTMTNALLNIFGVLSSNSLTVFNNAELAGNITLNGLNGTQTTTLCADQSGKIVYCSATPPPAPLTIETRPVTDVSQNGAQSGGINISGGSSPVTQKGVAYSSTSQTPVISGTCTNSTTCTNEGGNSNAFISTMTGLSANTLYYVRAYAKNNEGTVYGSVKQFTTSTGGFTLFVGKYNAPGATIDSVPAGINCNETDLNCEHLFPSGTTVTLTAHPNGLMFGGWSGDACNGSTSLTCDVTMTANKNIATSFSLCGGYIKDGYCWYKNLTQGQNCFDFCITERSSACTNATYNYAQEKDVCNHLWPNAAIGSGDNGPDTPRRDAGGSLCFVQGVSSNPTVPYQLNTCTQSHQYHYNACSCVQ